LMVFDAHHIAMPIAWIITSCQTFNDLVKWLNPLKTN
jgi:phosphatidylserine decarboxylase